MRNTCRTVEHATPGEEKIPPLSPIQNNCTPVEHATPLQDKVPLSPIQNKSPPITSEYRIGRCLLLCNQVKPSEIPQFHHIKDQPTIQMNSNKHQKLAATDGIVFCRGPPIAKCDLKEIQKCVELYQTIEEKQRNGYDHANALNEELTALLKRLLASRQQDGPVHGAFLSIAAFKDAFKSPDYVLNFASTLLSEFPNISKDQFMNAMAKHFSGGDYWKVFHELVEPFTRNSDKK